MQLSCLASTCALSSSYANHSSHVAVVTDLAVIFWPGWYYTLWINVHLFHESYELLSNTPICASLSSHIYIHICNCIMVYVQFPQDCSQWFPWSALRGGCFWISSHRLLSVEGTSVWSLDHCIQLLEYTSYILRYNPGVCVWGGYNLQIAPLPWHCSGGSRCGTCSPSVIRSPSLSSKRGHIREVAFGEGEK